MNITLKFNLDKARLPKEVETYWTYGEGYEFFLEKTKDFLLHLNKGDYFEFQAYSKHKDREVIKDFNNDKFQIIEKRGFVSVNGESRLIIEIQPIGESTY